MNFSLPIFACRDERGGAIIWTRRKKKRSPSLARSLAHPRTASFPLVLPPARVRLIRRHLFGLASKSAPVESTGFSGVAVAYTTQRHNSFVYFSPVDKWRREENGGLDRPSRLIGFLLVAECVRREREDRIIRSAITPFVSALCTLWRLSGVGACLRERGS